MNPTSNGHSERVTIRGGPNRTPRASPNKNPSIEAMDQGDLAQDLLSDVGRDVGDVLSNVGDDLLSSGTFWATTSPWT